MKTYFGTVIQKLREKSTNQELLTWIDILEQNHFDEIDEAVAKAYAEKWRTATGIHECMLTIRDKSDKRIVVGHISEARTSISPQGYAQSEIVLDVIDRSRRKIIFGPVDLSVGPTDSGSEMVYLGSVQVLR